MISFRQYRKRHRYTVSLYHVYVLAMYHTMIEDYKVKMAEYNIKKKAGFKGRKPRKPNVNMVSPYIRKIHEIGSDLHSKSKAAAR